MGVEQRAEAVDENHRADMRRGTGARTALPQGFLDRIQEDVRLYLLPTIARVLPIFLT